MATDVDVQFFSHLNGLRLSNYWGDLIRLLDKVLVTGIELPAVTAASMDEQGDVHITTYADHKALLFQVVELSGFTPASLNQKYRIKGVVNSTQLVLKPENNITQTTITNPGKATLAPMGYEIVFRDENDIKRVYRAKNPTAKHPFIRVDESLASETGSYTSSYGKVAMVGLLENMDHIDDFLNPNILQLPQDPAKPGKNWTITGFGAGVIRGWSRWYWATSSGIPSNALQESNAPTTRNREFTICGDENAFYLNVIPENSGNQYKAFYGAGVLNLNDTAIDKSWFLMSHLREGAQANAVLYPGNFAGVSPLTSSEMTARFFLTPYNINPSPTEHTQAVPIVKDYQTGSSGAFNSGPVGGIEIPVVDTNKRLRGTLPHVLYAGRNVSTGVTVPLLTGKSMLVAETVSMGGSYQYGNVMYYLGELE